MARAFSRSVSNSWQVQNDGSKTWTGELLNMPQVSMPWQNFDQLFLAKGWQTKFSERRVNLVQNKIM